MVSLIPYLKGTPAILYLNDSRAVLLVRLRILPVLFTRRRPSPSGQVERAAVTRGSDVAVGSLHADTDGFSRVEPLRPLVVTTKSARRHERSGR
jgi:hypothetical protein